MKNKRNKFRGGMASVMAMMYLALVAALAVGFYSAISTSGNIADNEQYVQRSGTAAEAGLAFGRYQLSQITLPYNTSAGTLLTSVYGALQSQTNLGSVSNLNMNGFSPTTQPSGSPTSIEIPGSSHWMSTDNLGGQARLTVTQPVSASMNMTLESVGQNANNVTANTSSAGKGLVQRAMEVALTSPEQAILGYGLVSFGEVYLDPTSGKVAVLGNNGGVFVVNNSGTPPIDNVLGSNTLSGDVFYTSTQAASTFNTWWGNLAVAYGQAGVNGGLGWTKNQSGFASHVHGGQLTPAAVPFDPSSYNTFSGDGAGFTTVAPGVLTTSKTNVNLTAPNPTNTYTCATANVTLTNATLNSGSTSTTFTIGATGFTLVNPSLNAGTYIFNLTKSITINGVMLIQPGTNVTFSTANGSTVTINGFIGQANSVTINPTSLTAPTGAITFTGTPVIQNSIGSAATLSAAEKALTGTALMLPTESLTFNGAATGTFNDAVVADSVQANANVTIASGALINVGSAAHFNAGLTINVNSSAATQLPVGMDYSFQATPSSYAEVNP